jgi:hypothetical protein
MKNLFKPVFLLILLWVTSCQGEKVDETQALKDEVIAIHDEVMPYMGELRSLKKEIELKSDSLSKEDSVAYAEKISHLNQLAEKLENAFEGMFVWMRQFKAPEEDTDKKEAKAYLEDQKILVEKVNTDIKTALEKAKSELNKN